MFKAEREALALNRNENQPLNRANNVIERVACFAATG